MSPEDSPLDWVRLDGVIDRLVAVVDEKTSGIGSAAQAFETKEDGSRVTATDRAIESAWQSIIRDEFPDHAFLGEEFGLTDAQSGYTWVVDPIDGTDDFSRALPLFGYIIAVMRGGVPVAAAMGHPQLGVHIRAFAGRGTRVGGRCVTPFQAIAPADPAIVLPSLDDFVRSSDNSALLLALARRFQNYRVYRNLFGHTAVIRGSLDACVEFDVAPWDFLATQLMVEEAGGRFVFFRVAPGGAKFGVAFGHPQVVDEVCKVLAEFGFECQSAERFGALRM